jgi:hypothetical protein
MAAYTHGNLGSRRSGCQFSSCRLCIAMDRTILDTIIDSTPEEVFGNHSMLDTYSTPEEVLGNHSMLAILDTGNEEKLGNHSMLDRIIDSTPEEVLGMKIFVSFPGKCIALDVQAGDNIDKVKAMLQDKEGLPSDRQRIIFGRKELVGDRALSYYNIQNKSKLHVEIFMELFVKTLTGKTFAVDVTTVETIYHVKAKIEKREGIPLGQQRLLFGDTELCDGRFVQEYNIPAKATLHLRLHLRNGIHVFVQTVAGTYITLEVEANESIRNVRAMVEDTEGILTQHQRLFFANRQLKDGRTLSDYNILKSPTMYLKLRFRSPTPTPGTHPAYKRQALCEASGHRYVHQVYMNRRAECRTIGEQLRTTLRDAAPSVNNSTAECLRFIDRFHC